MEAAMWVAGVLAACLFSGVLGVVLARSQRPTSAPDGAQLEARLDLQAAELRRLADVGRAGEGYSAQIASQVADSRTALVALQAAQRRREETEAEVLEGVRRLSTVLAGAGSKGRAGENVLREQLAALPPSLLLTEQRVNGKVVEFALALPDGRFLPVDSKWSGDIELQALAAADTAVDQDAAVRAVENVMIRRVREVAAYLDPSLTPGVAVAVVPDAVYEVLRKANGEAARHGVIIVPYAFALPVLLFLHTIVGRYGSIGDLSTCLAEVDGVLGALEVTLENKLARGVTMLQNGNDEVRSHLGKARGALARSRSQTSPAVDEDLDAGPVTDAVLSIAR